MTVDVCLALGRAVGAHCLEWFASRGSGERPLALIGRDTRRSGPMFEKALTSGLLSVGVDVLSLGVLPTPGVSLLTRQLGADAGLVISASHNPAHDNGVKVFLGTGFKLSDEQESLLEARCLDASTIESADASTTPATAMCARWWSRRTGSTSRGATSWSTVPTARGATRGQHCSRRSGPG